MGNSRNVTFVFNASRLDEYQRGFISGIMYFMTGKPSETYRWYRKCVINYMDLWYKDLNCTMEQCMNIYNEIEKHFPGVIVEMRSY